jgi:predicted dehydrogenase
VDVVSALGIAIIGSGFIGAKRAASLPEGSLQVVCDLDPARAAALAARYGAHSTNDWRAAVDDARVGIVVVATTHDQLAPITAYAAGTGRHVLVEKPAARRPIELDVVDAAVRRTGALVRVGFNHRFHRAFRTARQIVDSGKLGPLTHVRARYGHGGRLGYEREWRFDPAISGGGEAIDQGMHLIDLARWFLGDLSQAPEGAMRRYFWKSVVEDNAFFLLRGAEGKIAQLHASWSEWKNTFSFELYGRVGKLEITGLGGSYGVERLTHYAMSPALGPPETFIYEYPMADDSWEVEFAMFLEDIELGRTPSPTVGDARAALAIIETLYESEGFA